MTRVALVSGGGRGIGEAICLELARSGCDVAVNYRRDGESARRVVDAIKQLGRDAIALQASVEDFDQVGELVRRTVGTLGPPSVLVHNAGIMNRGHSVTDTEPSEMHRVVATHAFGAFYLAKTCAPFLTAQARSDIVMVSSTATRRLAAGAAPYNMGKSALEALASTLAKELAPHGTRVNVVAPGLVSTEMGDRLARAVTGGMASSTAAFDSLAPYGYVCTPEDVAKVVGFLVSEGARYLNGVRIPIDGGDADLSRRPVG